MTLFFSAAAIICIRIFFAGSSLSEESQVLTNAVIQAQNAAQLIKSDDGGMDDFCNYYGVKVADGVAEVYFDDGFEPCEGVKEAENKMVVQQTKEDDIVKSNISVVVVSSGENVYFLETKTYQGRNGQ